MFILLLENGINFFYFFLLANSAIGIEVDSFHKVRFFFEKRGLVFERDYQKSRWNKKRLDYTKKLKG